MNKESKQLLVKNKQNKSKKQDEKNKKKKINESSDDDDETYYPSEDSEYQQEDGEEEMDSHEYRKFLQKIFPSKYLDKKIKAGDKFKKTLEYDDESDSEEDVQDTKLLSKKYKNHFISKNNKKKSKKQEQEEDAWETEEEDEELVINKKKKNKNKNNKVSNKKVIESDSDEEEEQDEEEDDDEKFSKKKTNKFNIIFTIGGAKEDDEWDDEEYDDEDDWDDDDYEETENEDDSVSSSEDEEDDEDEDEYEEQEKGKEKGKEKVKTKKNEKKSPNKKNKKIEDDHDKNVFQEEEKQLGNSETKENEFLNQLKDIYEKNKNNPLVQKCIHVCEEDIQKTREKKAKKEKKHKAKNGRIFRKIIKDKNTMNDFAFFEKLEMEEQKKIIKELKEINKIMRVEKPYRITLLESNIPTIFKSAAMKKVNSLRYMEPGSGEYYKIKNWVDAFMRIPFNQFNQLPVTIEDGVDKCHDFMHNAQIVLNDSVYGMNDAKMQIMQLLGQLITNPKAIGTAIAIHGPPGTGKTTLLKEGVSKILNRPFAFIALGGATDSSFLEGHSYTYEGSTWGKIVQILIDSKCMNPVIYFDELDKISDTPRGEEITGILTHLTDTSQNSQFHDKYFAEIDFDLSKCLFIFSYNDESKVNPILKDRMYRIQTKGYNMKQKTIISNGHLLPKIREQVKFVDKDIIIPDETIHYIIEHFCNKEEGVRNLKRCLEIIHTKLNLYRLMKSETNLFEEEMSLKVEFPFTVTKDIVDKLIKLDKSNLSTLYSMYV